MSPKGVSPLARSGMDSGCGSDAPMPVFSGPEARLPIATGAQARGTMAALNAEPPQGAIERGCLGSQALGGGNRPVGALHMGATDSTGLRPVATGSTPSGLSGRSSQIPAQGPGGPAMPIDKSPVVAVSCLDCAYPHGKPDGSVSAGGRGRHAEAPRRQLPDRRQRAPRPPPVADIPAGVRPSRSRRNGNVFPRRTRPCPGTGIPSFPGSFTRAIAREPQCHDRTSET